jgi:dephospho-CoA kinase
MIIGVTGSIGTGKTTVAKMLGRLGAYVIDADAIVHRLLNKSTRKKLAAYVFDNEEALKKLCGRIHPKVKREILKRIKSRKSGRAIVIDAPLLIECGLDRKCDYVIVVKASRTKQLERARKKLSIPKDQILKRLRMQMPLREKISMADLVIDNNGALNDTEKQAGKIWEELARRKKWRR